jgi:uncharacterized membrane protein YidH (DUF202 family)
MARGGCNNNSCISGGGATVPTLLYIIIALGAFLIVMGIVIYNQDILDVSMQAIDKNKMNNYIGYTSIFVGVVLIFVAAMSMTHM